MPVARNTLREGLAVGLVAYAAVAGFYCAFDLLASRGVLFTVDMLGKGVFRGLRDPSVLMFPSELDPAAIFWYNALHLVISLAIGLLVVTLVTQAERRRVPTPLILLALFAGGVLTVIAVGLLTEGMRAVLPWWSIIVANALAALLAGLYLLRRHPGLWHAGSSPAARGDGSHGPTTGVRLGA